MKKSSISMLVAILWVLFACCADAILSPAYSADEAAETKARYEKLLTDYSQIVLRPSKKSPNATDYALKHNMLSSELASLLRKDSELAKKNSGVGYLDFDFLVNGQDLCKPLKVLGVVKNNATYAMKVSNRSKECCKDCDESPYFFVLIKEAGVWKIDDAQYSFKDDSGAEQKYALKDILNGKVD